VETRKPTNADFGAGALRERIDDFIAEVCLYQANPQRNGPVSGGMGEVPAFPNGTRR
jgi:hypothetical protein